MRKYILRKCPNKGYAPQPTPLELIMILVLAISAFIAAIIAPVVAAYYTAKAWVKLHYIRRSNEDRAFWVLSIAYYALWFSFLYIKGWW